MLGLMIPQLFRHRKELFGFFKTSALGPANLCYFRYLYKTADKKPVKPEGKHNGNLI